MKSFAVCLLLSIAATQNYATESGMLVAAQQQARAAPQGERREGGPPQDGPRIPDTDKIPGASEKKGGNPKKSEKRERRGGQGGPPPSDAARAGGEEPRREERPREPRGEAPRENREREQGDRRPPPPKDGKGMPPPPDGWTPPTDANGERLPPPMDADGNVIPPPSMDSRERRPPPPGDKQGNEGRGEKRSPPQSGDQRKQPPPPSGQRPPSPPNGQKDQGPPPPQSGQAPADKMVAELAEIPHEVGNVIDVGRGKNFRQYVIDDKFAVFSPIFLLFTDKDCRECRKGATELSKLAEMTQDKPKVGRVDCTYDIEACDLFLNHVKDKEFKFPYMAMLTSDAMTVYDGEIDAQKIMDDFVSDKKYQNFPKHAGMETSGQVIGLGRNHIMKGMAEAKAKDAAMQPWLIDRAFAWCFADMIGFTFWQLGLDFWKKQSKVTMFCLVVLAPILIILFHALDSMGVIDKLKQLKNAVQAQSKAAKVTPAKGRKMKKE